MHLEAPTPADDLALHAAVYSLGYLYSWELPPMADRCLMRGFYTPALAELAEHTHAVMSEVGPLFELALREAGQPLPTREAAAWLTVRHCATVLVNDRTVVPREWLRFIAYGISRAVADVLPDTTFVGSGLDVAALAGIHASYDEPGEDNTRLDAEARVQAWAWLMRHPAPGT